SHSAHDADHYRTVHSTLADADHLAQRISARPETRGGNVVDHRDPLRTDSICDGERSPALEPLERCQIAAATQWRAVVDGGIGHARKAADAVENLRVEARHRIPRHIA